MRPAQTAEPGGPGEVLAVETIAQAVGHFTGEAHRALCAVLQAG